MKERRIKVGTKVNVQAKAEHDRKYLASTCKARRRELTPGTVLDSSDCHGLCYRVRHEDGTESYYEPDEVAVVGGDRDLSRKSLGLNRRQLKMIEEFQCPGCVGGTEPATCKKFELWVESDMDAEASAFACSGHVLGTHVLGAGSFALGLPRGFCRPGFNQGAAGAEIDPVTDHRNKMAIRLYLSDSTPRWDNFNVAVWALETDGYLFVRTYSPRVNTTFVDVVEGGKREALCPNAIDVAPFYEDMD